MAKPDVVVIQGADGKPYVRPGLVVVGKAGNNKAPLVIRNCTDKEVVVCFPHGPTPETKKLDPRKGAKPKDQIDIDADGQKANPLEIGRAYPYYVYVDGVEAQGNSSPMVIIDE